MKYLRLFLAALLCATAAHGESTPRQVILMIADGMGFNHVTAASYYQFGREEGQVYWAFDRYAVSTHSDNNKQGYSTTDAWASFEYFFKLPTDSAAAATTMSTGVKTRNGFIGLGPDKAPLRHLIEDAESLGKSTGVLSTVRYTHATPAGFVAHNDGRGNEDTIAQEMLGQSAVDLILGPGHPWFDNDGKQVGGMEPDRFDTPQSYEFVGGLDFWKQLLTGSVGADANGDGQPDPWTVLQSVPEILALASGSPPSRVFGLIPVYGTLQAERSGDPLAPAFAIPLTRDMPTLSDLMRSGLHVLSQNDKGFFLMGEGGAVDWASHANRTGRMIEEQIDFDKAIEATVAWIETNSSWDNALLIITADHECGYLTGPSSKPDWKPIENRGIGEMPGAEWHTRGHTNQLVPLFVKGAGAERFREHVRGSDVRHGEFIDNTDIPVVIRALWGIS